MQLSTILIASALSVLGQAAALALPHISPGPGIGTSPGESQWPGPSPDVYRWINATFINLKPDWPFQPGQLCAWEVRYHVERDNKGKWHMVAGIESAHDPRITKIGGNDTVLPQNGSSPGTLSAHVGLTVSHKFPSGWELAIIVYWPEVFSAKGGQYGPYGGFPMLYDDKNTSVEVDDTDVSFIFVGTTK